MPHPSNTTSTTTDFFELLAGARTWLLQISGSLKAVFLPEGLLDYKDIPLADSAPDSPPVGRIREYWKDAVKQYKNSDGKVVRQLGFEQDGIIPIDIIGKGVGATKTTTRIDNCTIAEQFGVGEKVFAHVIIPDRVDPDEDGTILIAWYPVGSEASKLVSWQVEVVIVASGTLVNKAADVTLTAIDEASPDTAFTNIATTFTLDASDISPNTSLHVCITRIASSNDPSVGAEPAIHHASFGYKVK